jgi:3',5'-cyclic-AMP phosphodiesterase
MVRIAQLSDIHAKPGARSLQALDRALEWIAVAEPDAVIVSGDVANEPEYYELVTGPLGRVSCPLLMVPGNKDSREAMREAFPDMGWADGGALNIMRVVNGVRLIGLDVIVPGEQHGDAEPVIGWLKEQLRAAEPTVLFMHQHPFQTGFARVDKARCQNGDMLTDAILDGLANVLLVTCGHGHRTVFTRFAGVPAMMCPSLAKANVLEFGEETAPLIDPPGFALHIVEDGRCMSHVIPLGPVREP